MPDFDFMTDEEKAEWKQRHQAATDQYALKHTEGYSESAAEEVLDTYQQKYRGKVFSTNPKVNAEHAIMRSERDCAGFFDSECDSLIEHMAATDGISISEARVKARKMLAKKDGNIWSNIE